jgi:hypothetical protein
VGQSRPQSQCATSVVVHRISPRNR